MQLLRKPKSVAETIQLLREIHDKIDDVVLVYELKKYKLKRVGQCIDLIKTFIAIDYLGLNITTNLVNAILPLVSGKHISTKLHTLGDKHILLMKRKFGRKSIEWLLHPAFKKQVAEKCLKPS